MWSRWPQAQLQAVAAEAAALAGQAEAAALGALSGWLRRQRQRRCLGTTWHAWRCQSSGSTPRRGVH
jgi:hypothetical protein